MDKLRPWLVPLFLFIAFSAIQNASGQSPVDGVYLISKGDGPYLLILENGRFTVKKHPADEISGRFFYRERLGPCGQIEFSYFNGAETIRAVCTTTIENGDLWLGTFYPVELGKEKKVVWQCDMHRPGILGFDEVRSPRGRIKLDFDSKSMQTLSSGPGGSWHKPIGIHTLDTEKASLMISIDDLHWEKMVYYLMGFSHKQLHVRHWFWRMHAGQDPELLAKDKGISLAELAAEKKVGHFRKTESAVFAPWSRKLGPVGMKPTKWTEDEFQVASKLTWSNDKICLVSRISQVPNPFSIQDFDIGGRWENARVIEAQNRLVFRPDSHGINVRSFGWDCKMGHGDYPGYVIWFPVGEDRIVRWTSSPSCMGRDLDFQFEQIQKLEKE